MKTYKDFAEALLAGHTLISLESTFKDCIKLNDDGILCRTNDYRFLDDSEICLIDANVKNWSIKK